MTIVDDLEVAWLSGNQEILVMPLHNCETEK